MIEVCELTKRYGGAVAVDGRTVFVSSHLMSEMARTADHLIVIGRGRRRVRPAKLARRRGGAIRA